MKFSNEVKEVQQACIIVTKLTCCIINYPVTTFHDTDSVALTLANKIMSI